MNLDLHAGQQCLLLYCIILGNKKNHPPGWCWRMDWNWENVYFYYDATINRAVNVSSLLRHSTIYVNSIACRKMHFMHLHNEAWKYELPFFISNIFVELYETLPCGKMSLIILFNESKVWIAEKNYAIKRVMCCTYWDIQFMYRVWPVRSKFINSGITNICHVLILLYSHIFPTITTSKLMKSSAISFWSKLDLIWS